MALTGLELVWADGAYIGPFATWLANERGWRMEIPFHRQRQAWRQGLEERPAGFNVLPCPLRGLRTAVFSKSG